jgi:DNA-binding PadR family transcriptional regulator
VVRRGEVGTPIEEMDPERFLPLTPVAFEILLSVANGERHGYGIMQDIADSTGGKLLNPGTLYRAMARLEDTGLIEELKERPAPDLDDARRRYYAATTLGIRVAKAEARRLEAQVVMARSKKLLGRI